MLPLVLLGRRTRLPTVAMFAHLAPTAGANSMDASRSLARDMGHMVIAGKHDLLTISDGSLRLRICAAAGGHATSCCDVGQMFRIVAFTRSALSAHTLWTSIGRTWPCGKGRIYDAH